MKGYVFRTLLVLMAITAINWLLTGCSEDGVIPSLEESEGSISSAGNSGWLKNYNPDAGIEAPSGQLKRITLEDAFPWDKVARDPNLLAILNGGLNGPMAPQALPTIWYRTNAILNTSGGGYQEGTGTISSGAINFYLMPNEFVVQTGYETYWLIPRRGSSSGEFYYWLKLPNGTMPKYAEGDGKVHLKMAKDGAAQWVDKGSLILTRTITLENLAISASTKIYVKGDKSTQDQWLEMDYVLTTRRELKVMVSLGRETLEFKDGSGAKYRYKVMIDGTEVTYGESSKDYMPTFEYLEKGIKNLGNNLVYEIGITVAEGGGVTPQPPVTGEFDLVIDGSTMRLSPIDKTPFWQATKIFVPSSRNGWRVDDNNHAANVASNRWEFDLNKFPRDRANQITRLNLYATQASWFLKEKLPDHLGWAQTNKGEWSLAIVWNGSRWKWYQEVFPVSQLVPENPD